MKTLKKLKKSALALFRQRKQLERQTQKEINQLIYPNHLKYLKKLKAELKRDKGMKPRRNWNPFRKKK